MLEKIESKHGVALAEVEEACLSAERRDGLYKVFSRATSGRYILTVPASQGRGIWRVVTAASDD